MKTPEQMADEYSKQITIQDHCDSEAAWYAEKDFLAGYQAAKDQLADADKVMNSPEKPDGCDYIVDVNKMVNIKLRQACDDMLEVLSPVTQAPINDYIEHLEKIAVGNTSNNSNGWISVKDRLPEIDKYVLITHRISQDYTSLKVMEGRRISDDQYEIWGDHAILADYVDYWMELPLPPKGEG